MDEAGNVNVAEYDGNKVRKIDVSGAITSLVSSGFRFDFTGVAVGMAGNVYVAGGTPYTNNIVRKIDGFGTITTLAATGEYGYSGDGGPASEAQLSYPQGVEVDGDGKVYVVDRGDSRVRRIDPLGISSTLAGTGDSSYLEGTGPVQADSVSLNSPLGAALDSAGNLFFVDGGRLWKLAQDGTIAATSMSGIRFHNSSGGVAVDAVGNVYVGDSYSVFKIDVSGTITTLADAEDLGGWPPEISALAVDEWGNVYVGANHAKAGRIWRIQAGNGGIEATASTGEPGFEGEGIPVGNSRLWVSGIAVDRSGNVWFTDTVNRRVRVLERLR